MLLKNSNTPIVLFVYARPDHTRKTVEALLRNDNACNHDLIVYSDAAFTKDKEPAVNEVRTFLDTINGFRTISINHRQINFGLAKSLIEGVSEVINKYGRVIVLEDDIVTGPFFLKFMNQALAYYENELNIGSITGFSLPVSIPLNYPNCVYLTHRHSSWGWGTYKRVWDKIDWDVKDYQEFKHNKYIRDKFNVAGPDMSTMLDLQMNSKINSWSIRFDFSCFKNNLYSVAPTHGLLRNIGFDGTGVHCGKEPTPLIGSIDSTYGTFNFPINLEFNYFIVKSSYDLFRPNFLLNLKNKLKFLLILLSIIK